MSEVAQVDPSPSPAFLLPGQAPIIEKTPPRPAPTEAYCWRVYNPEARVLYIRNHEQANIELAKLGSGPQALGFDLEWKPTFIRGARENPVALVQLANNDTVFLLQITAMKEFPSKLLEILANPLIVKAGVAIQNDAKKIYNDWQVPMCNCVDLSLLARTVDNARWQGKYNASLGLARLIESYEYRLMVKGKIARTNWEAYLNEIQLEYASNDAHAGYILYRKLESMIPCLQDPPESVWYTFNLVSGQLMTSDGIQWHANNPNYDPGPPPPPRLPREMAEISSTEFQTGSQAKSDWKSRKDRKDRRLPFPNQQHEHRPRNLVPSTQFQAQEASGSGSRQYQADRGFQQRRSHNNNNRGPSFPAHHLQAQGTGVSPNTSMEPSAQFHTSATPSSFPSNIRGARTDRGFFTPGPSRNHHSTRPNHLTCGTWDHHPHRPAQNSGQDTSAS